MPTSDLSRARMIAIVDSGESFIHDGKIVADHDGIPAAEDLASSPADRNIVRQALEAERDALERRLAQLDRDGAASESATAPTSEEAAKIAAADAAFAEKKAKAEADAATNGAIEAEHKTKGPPEKAAGK